MLIAACLGTNNELVGIGKLIKLIMFVKTYAIERLKLVYFTRYYKIYITYMYYDLLLDNK